MTPSQMFKQNGSDEKAPFQKGDKVNTPTGLAEFISQFTRGLKWWCETSTGTFSAETINSLNEQKCDNCGKAGGVIQAPDQYEGWCLDCARSDAMADSDAYDYRTEQIEGNGW